MDGEDGPRHSPPPAATHLLASAQAAAAASSVMAVSSCGPGRRLPQSCCQVGSTGWLMGPRRTGTPAGVARARDTVVSLPLPFTCRTCDCAATGAVGKWPSLRSVSLAAGGQPDNHRHPTWEGACNCSQGPASSLAGVLRYSTTPVLLCRAHWHGQEATAAAAVQRQLGAAGAAAG